MRLHLPLILLICGSALAADAPGDLLGKVERSIRTEQRLRVYDWIQLSLRDTEVTLSGFVSLPSLKDALEERVRAVHRLGPVVNLLEVLPQSSEDMAMRVNAYWRIYGEAELRSGVQVDVRTRPGVRPLPLRRPVLLRPIHIIVRDGHITLEGEVEEPRDAEAARAAALQVMGVRSVTNHLLVIDGDRERPLTLQLDPDPWWSAAPALRVPTLRVENPSGQVRVQVMPVDAVQVRTSSPDREVRRHDVVVRRQRRKIHLEAKPADGALIDLDIDLPYGYQLQVATADGPIKLRGLVRKAELTTGTGTLELAGPWEAMRLSVTSRRRPREVSMLASLRASGEVLREGLEGALWTLVDVRPAETAAYGEIQVSGNWPERLAVDEMPIPDDSPVRMHWEAPEALRTMFRPGSARVLQRRASSARRRPAADDGLLDEGSLQFSSDVRLVDLAVTVVDHANRPLTGLRTEDFTVLEEGVSQEVRFADGEEMPFNLVLLLDCSTSTVSQRSMVFQAAKRFARLARQQDQMALHVLSDTYLHVLSPLTGDREKLSRKIAEIPPLSGGTPLYDGIVLSYAKELAGRRFQRNALIVISDGMDNQILPRLGRLVPSQIPFGDLKRAAAEMNAVIYPIYLDAPGAPRTAREPSVQARKEQARRQFEDLAAATGGRVFRAPSIVALLPAYREVAEELRGVYRVAYYPKDQNFDGSWRRVEVKVRQRGARVRARVGYYAR